MHVVLVVAGVVAVWVAGGVLTYGRVFAHFEYMFPTNSVEMHKQIALALSIAGPIAFIVVYLESRKTGCGFKYTDGCKWVK